MGVSIGVGTTDWEPPRRGGRISFTVDNPGLDAAPFGMTTLNMGDDPQGPAAVVFSLPPNLEFATHYHETEQCFVVLEGSIRIGRTWFGPGSVRVQDEGSVYGPGLAGPEGCKAISFYGDRSKLPDRFASERDRKRYEALATKHGYADLATRHVAAAEGGETSEST
jgi:hypothetical protein